MNENIRREWIVNKEPRSVSFEPHARLLDVLRDRLGLKGSKEGCGEGECGACSVLIEGELKLACLQLAAAVRDGSAILTIEGLSGAPGGAILTKNMLEHGGVQCGFCTPGMMMAAYWYLQTRPPLDVKSALSGNLCRCTGYQKIVNAVEAAASEWRRS